MIPDALKTHLRAQTNPATGDYLFAAVAIDGPDGAEVFLTGRTHPDDFARDRPDLMHNRVRAASISKTVTARILAGLVPDGVLDLETPVFDLLRSHGYPDWLDHPMITPASLLSHTSGLRDANGYIPEDGGSLPEFLHRVGPVSKTAPGHFFYSNLGIIIAGAVAEAASGRRFDDLATDVLRPLGLHGGFNWSTVKPEERAKRLPLYQRHGTSYTLTADGPDGDWSADLIWRNGVGVSLDTYALVRDTHLFSPHAGLRASLPELARLARSFCDDTRQAKLVSQTRWTYDGSNGAWSDSLFPEVGLTLTRYRNHDCIPGHLLGHAGHALGFTGGAWCNVETKTGWAYALLGAVDETEGSDEEVFFNSAELAIFRAI